MKTLLMMIMLLSFSCTKDNMEYCWECKDAAGNDIDAGGCNLTKSEAKASLEGKKSTTGETFYSKDFDKYCKKK